MAINDRPPLLSLDEALVRLLQGAADHAIAHTETVSTFDGLGRVLATEVRSAIDVPGADNSSMDGYALRVADAAAGSLLPVAQRIPAGVVGQPLAPHTAARIFTGAQVPAGADAVLMQEQGEAVPGEGLGAVRVRAAPVAGEWIRRRGEDVCAGDVVLPRGARLTPQALGLAAGVGAATLQVVRRPRVALLSTGDELVMPGEPLRPGAIYNSNRFMLRGLLQACGCDVTDLGIVPDRLQATREALRQAALGHDLILSSGGVSVGEEDHLKPAVQAEGRLGAVAGRHQAGQAAGLRRGARLQWAECAVRRSAGQPGVQFRHLPAVRGSRAAGAARRGPVCACGPADARRFRLVPCRQAPRVPARAPQRCGRAGPVRQPEFGRAHLDRLG